MLIGHVDPRRGFVIDATVARALVAGAETVLSLSLSGSTVSVLVDGQIALSYAYNAAVTDGAAGLLARNGAGSFDRFLLRTDDRSLAGPVLPSVSIADATATEGASGSKTVTLQLTLSSAATAPVSVGWATSSGSAAAGSDFATASGTVTFAAGATTASISLTIFGDTVFEPDESFGVNLSAPVGLTIADGSALVVIANDDASPLPSLSIADASVVEGNSGSKTVTLTVTLSAASSSPVTVQYATVNGTATAGSDYRAATGTITFAAGVTSRTFTVTILGDRTKEPNETFRITLSAASGATILDGDATVTIVTDEAALTAASAPVGAHPARALTPTELALAAAEAKSAWLLLRPDADVSAVTFAIADLPELLLANTSGSTITVDATAAGWGWSVSYRRGGGLHMDLVAALMHELGHVLGLEHAGEGLMAETLAPVISSRCRGGATGRSTGRAPLARLRQLLLSSRSACH